MVSVPFLFDSSAPASLKFLFLQWGWLAHASQAHCKNKALRAAAGSDAQRVSYKTPKDTS
jgi:hypothetical protein